MTEKKKFDHKAKSSMIIMGALIGSALFIVALTFILAKNKINQNSGSQSSIPNMVGQNTIKDKNGSSPTDNYDKMAKSVDSTAADAAASGGKSFVPSFAPAVQDVNKKPESATSAVSANEQSKQYEQFLTKPEDKKQEIQATQNNDIMDGKMKRLEQLSSSFIAEGYAPIQSGESSWQDSKGKESSLSDSTTKATSVTTMLIKAGERAYISIDTSINTDEPSPVIATILSGNGNGMTIFGSSRHNPNDTISVEFSRLALPSGKSVAISAFAIDPQSGRTSVQGSVDHKIFERFLLPAVAAGISKYGEASANQGTSTTVGLVGVTTKQRPLTAKELRSASIGAGVGRVAAVLDQVSSEAKVAVSTKRNLGIEIVFVQEVMVEK